MIAVFDLDSTLNTYIQKKVEGNEVDYLNSTDELLDILKNNINTYTKILINSNNLDNEFLQSQVIPILDDIHKQAKVIFYEINNNICSIINTKLFSEKGYNINKTSIKSKTTSDIKQIKVQKRQLKYEHLIIGISTGGPATLEVVLPQFPKEINFSIVVVQHMLRGNYIFKLCERLDKISKIEVKVAENGEILKNGIAYFPPPGTHLSYKKENNGLVTIVLSEKYLKDNSNIFKANNKFIHIPSVDIGIESASDMYGDRLIAAIFTGMGSDGALALKYARDNGAYTLSEAEETSKVYGMPKAAYEKGGSMEVLKHYLIPGRILDLTKN